MNTNIKKIAMLGLLLAAQVVASKFFSINLPLVTIGFLFLPRAITSILYGPLWGGISSVMGDFLIGILSPWGYFPPMATTAFLSGAIYGIFLYKKPLTLPRITLCVLAESLICSVLVQTYWLTRLSGKGFFVLLPIRLGQNLLVAPVAIVCLRLIAPRICQALSRLGYATAPSTAAK